MTRKSLLQKHLEHDAEHDGIMPELPTPETQQRRRREAFQAALGFVGAVIITQLLFETAGWPVPVDIFPW